MAEEKKEVKKSFYKGVRSEFKKIIWPTKDDLVKQTIVVSIVSLFLGSLIAAMDWIIKFGLGFILK